MDDTMDQRQIFNIILRRLWIIILVTVVYIIQRHYKLLCFRRHLSSIYNIDGIRRPGMIKPQIFNTTTFY